MTAGAVPERGDMDPADVARWLMLVVRELRELGIDPPLVRLSEDGVSLTGLTLLDELYLIACQISFDGAMSAPTAGDGEQG